MPRSTRQTTAQSSQFASSQSASISRDPVARRGAPKGPASVVSIATEPPRAEGQSEDDDDDPDAREDVATPVVAQASQDGSVPAGDADDEEATPDEDQRVQIMKSLLPDLLRATEELHNRLQNGSHDSPVFRTLLGIKRSTFQTYLEAYANPEAQPGFIDYAWIEDLDQRTGVDSAVSKAVALANLVIGLDESQLILGGDTSNALRFLEGLDRFFPQRFLSPQNKERCPRLALAIRTCYLIESLASSTSKGSSVDVKASIADTFCANGNEKETDYAKLFSQGPFLSLGGYLDDEETDLCSARAAELFAFSRKDRKTHGVSKMREKYPLEELIKELKVWFLDKYAELRTEIKGPAPNSNKNGSHDVFYDAADTIPESIPESNPESQEIIRQPPSDSRRQMGPSLFKGLSSLQELNASGERSKPPPSNQQGKAPSEAPSDYPNDSTAALLTGDLVPGNSGRTGTKRRHTAVPNIDEDDDDEEGEFETDVRKVDEGRRATIAADQQNKRQRLTDVRPATMSQPAPLPSQRQPPVSSMPPPSSLVPSSSADTEAIRYRKAEVMAQARARSSQVRQKQRFAWTDQDSDLLLSLIPVCHAKWADIERLYNGKFQHPRNQQAYRDKARNMKVDYLITDAVLPPGFDLVALSSKEIDRLRKLGKNPFRKEQEFVQDGDYVKATNTEDAG